MKKRLLKKFICISLLTMSILSINSINAHAEWKQNSDNTWSYYDVQGRMQTGWIKDTNGKYYYLNNNGIMQHDTIVNGYKLGSDGSWIQNNVNNIGNTTTTTNNGIINNYYGAINNNVGDNNESQTSIETMPINIPSKWESMGNNGYIINGRTAIVYKPKYLQGYPYEKALNDIGSAIINDKNNSDVHTEYKKYNDYPAIRCEYVSTDSNGKVQKNCFVVVVTTSKLYGFMVVGDNNYGFDIDELDLELALSISFKI